MDLLLEAPLREVRRRFLEEISPSSKGLGRVEQGSEETARSLDWTGLEAGSIWLVQSEKAGRQLFLRKRGGEGGFA